MRLLGGQRRGPRRRRWVAALADDVHAEEWTWFLTHPDSKHAYCEAPAELPRHRYPVTGGLAVNPLQVIDALAKSQRRRAAPPWSLPSEIWKLVTTDLRSIPYRMAQGGWRDSPARFFVPQAADRLSPPLAEALPVPASAEPVLPTHVMTTPDSAVSSVPAAVSGFPAHGIPVTADDHARRHPLAAWLGQFVSRALWLGYLPWEWCDSAGTPISKRNGKTGPPGLRIVCSICPFGQAVVRVLRTRLPPVDLDFQHGYRSRPACATLFCKSGL